MPQIKSITTVFGVVALSACTSPSVQHAAQSADHSAQATGHSVAAAGGAVATVSAVPVAVTGSALAVTGAALADVGEASASAAIDVLDETLVHTACSEMQACVAADGPPELN